jgi:hypothetical protein
MVRVTHPFHPWSGREFVFVAVRQTWAEDRAFFLDAEGRQHSLPVTSYASPNGAAGQASQNKSASNGKPMPNVLIGTQRG